ncbi:hypothetical protein [Streptomyces sp. NPDC058426]
MQHRTLPRRPLSCLVRLAATVSSSMWQCMRCGAWFSSPTPSQTCGNC